MKRIVLGLATCLAVTAVAGPTPKPPRIEISVTSQGFEPTKIEVPAKKPVTLVFTRKTDKTCTKSVVLSLEGGKTVERALPLDTPVELSVTFSNAGTLGYACSMNMDKGVIVVR